MRDVKEVHTLVLVLSAFLRAKAPGGLTNESEGSSPSNRRISAHVRVVVLGVLRRAECVCVFHSSPHR